MEAGWSSQICKVGTYIVLSTSSSEGHQLCITLLVTALLFWSMISSYMFGGYSNVLGR